MKKNHKNGKNRQKLKIFRRNRIYVLWRIQWCYYILFRSWRSLAINENRGKKKIFFVFLNFKHIIAREGKDLEKR